jgi:hypothetical protein
VTERVDWPVTETTAGTVEELLQKVEAITEGTKSFELYVPGELTWQGKAVTQNLGMTLVLDRLLAKDLFPDGFEQRTNGRLYKYTSEFKERK